MGRLVAAHPRYHLIRTEARFHAVPGGLPDLIAGRVEMAHFLERFDGPWWKRGPGQGQGLQRVAEREVVERALAEFQATFDDDPWEASRRLVRAVLDPAAAREGKPAWVEVTGWTIGNAPTLHRLFPGAKFINMVRDGRAVVAGTLRKTNLTDDPMEALRNWEEMVRASDAGIRLVPEEAVLVVSLDDLVARDRRNSRRRLVHFLELEDGRPVRRYFRRKISADAAHVGRWRERMPPPDARRVDRRYRRLVRKLRREGVSWVPMPEDGALRLGPLRLPGLIR
jgi:hypothetical protein